MCMQDQSNDETKGFVNDFALCQNKTVRGEKL